MFTFVKDQSLSQDRRKHIKLGQKKGLWLYDMMYAVHMYMPHMHYIDLRASEGKNFLCGMEVNS